MAGRASRQWSAPPWAIVGLVLAGYLAALGTTPAGSGLRLLGHLAHAHGDAPPAPAYRPDPADARRPVLPTLREATPVHTHGDAAPHRHRPGARTHGARPAAPVVRAVAPVDDAHRHGDTVHSHTTDESAPPVPAVLASVDTHRMPDVARVPPPPPARDAPRVTPVPTAGTGEPPVETPPPRGRG